MKIHPATFFSLLIPIYLMSPGEVVIAPTELETVKNKEAKIERYIVNKSHRFDGLYTIHRKSCRHYGWIRKSQYLGEFQSCDDAIVAALTYVAHPTGCHRCNPSCNGMQ